MPLISSYLDKLHDKIKSNGPNNRHLSALENRFDTYQWKLGADRRVKRLWAGNKL